MAWFHRHRDRHRFYLFAGMGGKAARRRNKMWLICAISVGILVSACLAAALYVLYRLGR